MSSTNRADPIRVAIVGSGMAGLVTAYLLQRDTRQQYVVKVFESGKSLSLDSASVSIPKAVDASSNRVDLPMRAFAGGYYNNLKAMYDHLGVKYHSQPFLFEFSRSRSRQTEKSCNQNASSSFIHASNLHEMPPPRPRAATLVSYIAEVLYLLICYAWFSICCFLVAPQNGPHGPETLEQYLKRNRIPTYFTTCYVLPLISSVTTCPHDLLLQFPATDVINYKKRTHRAPHYTVSNGVNTVQQRLSEGIDCELSAPVSRVTPVGDKVKLAWEKIGEDNSTTHEEVFDKVILAIAPDVVGKIFEPLQRFMAKIPTTIVESVVHTDRSTLSYGSGLDRRLGKSGAQLIYLRTATDGTPQTESHHVQRCGSIVTTCPFNPIDSALKIHSAKFTRVLRSTESQRIVNSIFEDTPDFTGDEKSRPLWKNGDGHVWLVGGWCWDGMVLLEGCIVSAMRVANALHVEIPWRS